MREPEQDEPLDIGPYRTEAVLGAGGMGVVHRAVGPDGRRVALKTLRSGAKAVDRVRFEREGLLRLDHPNIVRVLDAGVDARTGTPYLALELLDGEGLDRRFARGVLSPNEAIGVGVAVCDGLEALHALGVVHRDLKPGNLFRCSDGTVKILDFGIARVEDSAHLTRTGIPLGTAIYMSPEQARGEREVDRRTDVWALGNVLYEALAGRAPFLRSTYLATVLAVVAEDVPGLELPPPWGALAAVVMRCLRKAPDERWPDVKALRDALLDVEAAASRASITPQVASTSLLPPDEPRIVTIVLASHVSDLDALAEEVVRAGGELTPLLGASALAVFGGRVWHGDEYLRAAQVALAVRGGVGRVSVACGRMRETGAGIDGEALARARAGIERALAGVAADEEVAHAVEEVLEVRWSPDGAEIAKSQVASSTTATFRTTGRRTVGRVAELGLLRVAVERLHTEQRGTTLVILGAVGVGKSVLAQEAAAMATGRGHRVLLARAEPQRRSQALDVFAGLLRSAVDGAARASSLTGQPPGESVELRLQALVATVQAAVADATSAREHVELLASFLGVTTLSARGSASASRTDPQVLRDRLRLALLDYFSGAADSGPPLLVIVEDLQWADDASLDLLDELASAWEPRPCALVMTARPELLERRADFLQGRDVTRTTLRGLARDALTEHLTQVAGRPLPDPILDAVWSRTAGNPFFAEQIVRALVEDRQIDDATDLPLPVSVEAAVQGRLDALPPDLKSAVKAFAVLGGEITASAPDALGVAMGRRALEELTQRELLVARRRGRHVVWAFQSELVAEVAARMLGDVARRELHRRAADWLAAEGGLEPERIAAHLDAAGASDEAAPLWAEAAVLASRRGVSETVLAFAERAGRGRLPRKQAFDLGLARADALRFLGQRDAQGVELALLADVAETELERALVHTEQAVWALRTGGPKEALPVAREALALAQRSNDAAAIAWAAGRLGEVLVAAGDLAGARAALDSAEGFATTPIQRALYASCRALAASAEGDVGAASSYFRVALEACLEGGDARRAVAIESNLADASNRLGRYEAALEQLDAALARCRRVGHRTFEGYVLLNQAYSLVETGALDRALDVLRDASRVATRTLDARIECGVDLYRARCELRRGQPRVALDLARSGAQRAARLGQRELEAQARVSAARALLDLGRLPEALADASAAMEIRDAAGGLAESEAELYLTLARCHAVDGRVDDATRTIELGRSRLAALAQRIADEEARNDFLTRPAAHRALMGTGPIE
ncbi:MAG: protein kinase [Deltaproteobacteria bacterium]|nr:protein kinase [Deltaproteobacteria bacterium]